ncbi:GNAT family N-acetyltransferase [Erythrobacter sp. MTPC3]|uniref:GNAT family N-acetyltransferase n=1 Tax=Erythrobacter sp. MTPC3 TaxID=3056564 RepID=UPI0036F1C8B7
MSQARYHDNADALQASPLRVVDTHCAAPFDRPEWFEMLGATGLEPQIITASDDDGETALALTGRDGHLTSLRNWYSFIWRPQHSPHGDVAQRLERLAHTLKDHGHRVTFEPVPDEDGSAAHLFDAFRKAGWHTSMKVSDTNHFLPVDGRNFAQYWASRPGQLRTTLKRKSSKVVTRLTREWDAAAWTDYEHIYRKSWKPAEDQPAMLRAFAQAEAAAGRMRLGRAFADGKAIAAQFWTVEAGTAFIHKLAHLEEHKHLSAGTVLSAAMFEFAIDTDQVETIDFGTGDERYKADWMDKTRPRYRIDCLNPRAPRSWPALAKSRLRGLIARTT